MKKKIVYLSIVFCLSQNIFAQNVGINTTGATPDNSAMLDIDAGNRGLLIPRVALSATNNASPVTSPATSLMVYNTATAGTAPNNVTPGYYYWGGSAWIRVATDGENWRVLGNAGTNPSTNFVGTTDANDLQFRTNNINRMRIMSSTYPTVGIGTTVPVTNLSGNSAVLHLHDGGNSVGSQLILSNHSTTSGARTGVINFAGTQITNDRRTASIESFLTDYTAPNATGDLRFFTNNSNVFSEKMRIDGNGQVSIATTSPTTNYLLTVNPTINLLRSGISIPMSGATSTAFGINITAANGNSRGLFYTNTTTASGVVYGVGAEITGGAPVSGYLSYRTGSPNNYGVFGITGTNATYNSTNANAWAGFFQGRVVISGETSPTSVVGTDLEIRNTTTGAGNPVILSMRQSTSNATNGTILTQLNFGDNYSTNPQAAIFTIRDAAGGAGDNPTALLFGTTPDGSAAIAERMRINNAGNVRIGNATIPTTNPTNTTDNPFIRISATGGFAYFGNFNCDPAGIGNNGRPGQNFINGVGALAIGMNRLSGRSGVDLWNTTSHDQAAANGVYDRGFYFRNYNTSGNEALLAYINGNGDVYGTSFNNISDKRTKTNFSPYENSLEKVLKVKTYNYILLNREYDDFGNLVFSESEKKQDFGFIAQELYEIFPELVKKPKDENKELWAVSYDKMVVVLTKAIQEQQAIIESQKNEIEQLKKKSTEIDNLKAEIDFIKSQLNADKQSSNR